MRNYSTNQPSLSTLILTYGPALITIPANGGRTALVIQNQSAADAVVASEEGVAGQPWTCILTGIEAGKQGAELPANLASYKGTVFIFAASDARILAIDP